MDFSSIHSNYDIRCHIGGFRLEASKEVPQWKNKDLPGATMKLNELFLEQLENEAKSTRRVLERVPEGRNDWKPHEKSTALGYLAALVAKMPAWIAMMVDRDEYELTSKDPRFQPVDAKTNAELLRTFDEAVAIGRQALQKANDEHLRKNWKFVVNGMWQASRHGTSRSVTPCSAIGRTIAGS
jgi:hypothetical protein